MSDFQRTDLEKLGELRAVASAMGLLFMVMVPISQDRALAWALLAFGCELSWAVLVVLCWLTQRWPLVDR